MSLRPYGLHATLRRAGNLSVGHQNTHKILKRKEATVFQEENFQH